MSHYHHCKKCGKKINTNQDEKERRADFVIENGGLNKKVNFHKTDETSFMISKTNPVGKIDQKNTKTQSPKTKITSYPKW